MAEKLTRGILNVFSVKKDISQSGFTLVELLVAIGIISLLAAVAVPNVMGWLPNVRLRSTARDLYADMQKAKAEAVRTNSNVTFAFTVVGDDPAYPDGRYVFTDAGGRVITDLTLSHGVRLSASTFGAGSGFTPQALPAGGMGIVTLIHPDTPSTYYVSQSVAGGVSIRNWN
ncbi:MAG: GspH/FimT family pseudopilin [Desulfobulbaceae bacterium]|nr:GspH/FimT family pseudopilin [Desulfobulbaceae bacterium]